MQHRPTVTMDDSGTRTMSKILVIDDEEANVRVLSLSLKLDGHEVVTACSGEEGIEVFQKESPDIVLTDIKMPGMSGIDVLKKVKSLEPDKEVIIITGHGDVDNAVEALQHGASDFINKPIRDEVLSLALKRAEEKLCIKRRLKEYTDNLENKVRIATRKIRRQSNFQSKLIRSSNDGIVATDETFSIVIFNPGAERIFGYSRAEVIGSVKIPDLFPPEVIEMLQEEAGATGELPWKETMIISRDGTRIPVRFSGTFLHEKKAMMGSVAFFQDLREIKRLEAELVRSERLAAIGQTVAGLAHGVKNILHGFKGGSYLVDLGIKKGDSEKLKKGWDMIKRNISRTSDLVMDLLTYSKERKPEFEVCSPNEIARDVCEVLKESAKENLVEIITDFDPSVGQIFIDPRTLHCALTNLMSNAIDACIFDESPDKKWQVRLTTIRENGNIVCFEISDNGAGMTEEVRDKLFTSFFSTKGHRGTGLGLLVTRKMIEEHKGEIMVSSELGRGTSFVIRLPYEEAGSESKE